MFYATASFSLLIASSTQIQHYKLNNNEARFPEEANKATSDNSNSAILQLEEERIKHFLADPYSWPPKWR